MARRLDSDQLGKKGQDHFSQLCVDAGLIPNPSSWDRKGWDFVVDWRHEVSATAYDTRPTLPSCLVQVKTIWAGGRKVRLPLLAAEHLAKDLKPAFICVLEVDDQLDVAAMHIAHFEGDYLGDVLKALRKARAEDKRVARASVEPSLAHRFQKVPVSGLALRKHIEDAIGPSLADYAVKKQKQLEDLGFEDGGRQITFKMVASDHSHFAEAVLGMRQIEVKDALAQEIRFGIAIADPDFPAGSGRIEFTPNSEGTCVISASAPSLDRVEFKADVFTLPGPMVEAGLLFLRLKAQLFTMLFSFSDEQTGKTIKTKFDIRTDGDAIREARLSASQWRDFYAMLKACRSEPVNLEVQRLKPHRALISTVIRSKGAPDAKADRDRKFLTNLTAAAARLFDRAGAPRAKMKIDDLVDAADGLKLVDALMNGSEEMTPLSFISTKTEHIDPSVPLEILYLNRVTIGKKALAYATSTHVTPTEEIDQIRWTSGPLKFRDIQYIASTHAALRTFAHSQRKATGIDIIMMESQRPSRVASSSEHRRT